MNSTLKLSQIATQIIKEQELIIGPLAWEEARKVPGLSVIDTKKGEVVLQNEDPGNTIDKLVAQYEKIFGRTSHEVCREAVKDIIAKMPEDEIPSSLR